MWLASKAITIFLSMYESRGRPGNHDPLTRKFIEKTFLLWTGLLWGEGIPDEGQVFNRLLVASWRDFQFPNKEDESGVSVEDWLSDRVRKQFPQGIYSARLRDQEQITYELWLYKYHDLW